MAEKTKFYMVYGLCIKGQNQNLYMDSTMAEKKKIYGLWPMARAEGQTKICLTLGYIV
jgi:hypothetical protein